jgi:hypothetical protein
MKKRKLKPCPNCGSTKLTMWHRGYPRSLKCHVECRSCHFSGHAKVFAFRAERAWNRRAILIENLKKCLEQELGL